MKFDSKEYTRIRDIVHKRNVRQYEAGLSPLVHFPTVKEIKAGFVSPYEAMKELQNYYSGGSTVKAVRQTGYVPEFKSFPQMPPERKKSEAEKRERKRASDRAYRRRKAIRDNATNPAKAKKHESYLKALETVDRTWKKHGVDIGLHLKDMTPAEAKAFVNYMDVRFSQGDFSMHYVIDEFIQDFSKLLQKGHKAGDIIKDFNQFVENQSILRGRSDSMEGMSQSEFSTMWSRVVGD